MSTIFISGISVLEIRFFILTILNFFSKTLFFQVFIEGVALPNISFIGSLLTLSKATSLAS